MIRLSRLTDYAVTLLTHIAREGKGVLCASSLADSTGLPLPTVSKILKKLAKSGIITATRGAAGGYNLTRSADQLSIATVVEAMDGPIAITDCAGENVSCCKIETICSMSGNWNKVNQAMRAALESVSLADMAAHSNMPRAHVDVTAESTQVG